MRRSVSFQVLRRSHSTPTAAQADGRAPVAAVDDDVAGGEVWHDLLDELVHNLAGLHHELNAGGLRQIGNHLLDGVAADDGLALGAAFEKLVHLAPRVNGLNRAQRQNRSRRTLEVVRL